MIITTCFTYHWENGLQHSKYLRGIAGISGRRQECDEIFFFLLFGMYDTFGMGIRISSGFDRGYWGFIRDIFGHILYLQRFE